MMTRGLGIVARSAVLALLLAASLGGVWTTTAQTRPDQPSEPRLDETADLSAEYQPVWTEALPNPPLSRHYHGWVYDSTRQRFILFGGWRADGTPLADTWEFDGQRWYQINTPQAPSARWAFGMAYDSARERVVLFGGTPGGGVVYSDTWEYDGSTWIQVPTLHAPPARAYGGMTFDSSRGVVVLFGGTDQPGPSSHVFDDTWEYDGTDWLQRFPTQHPSGRTLLSAMVYDSQRERVIIHGGWVGSGCNRETWEYDGSNWTQRSSSGPSRYAHSLAYDSVRGRVIFHGGGDCSQGLNDTWEYNPVTAEWSQIAVSTPPSAYEGPMVYNPTEQAVWLFGGAPLSGSLLDELWEYDAVAQNWSPVAYAPMRREEPAVAYDSHRQRVILFGGSDGSRCYGDTWEYDGVRWARVATTGPSARNNARMVYDAAHQLVVLFGGYVSCNSHNINNQTWLYNPATHVWTQAFPSSAPSARGAHHMAYDSARGRTVLFGGWNDYYYLNDTWEYDGGNWAQVTTAHAPEGRAHGYFAYDAANNRVTLLGGYCDGYCGSGPRPDDMWAYNGSDWTLVLKPTGLSPRTDGAMVYDSARDRLVLFGGETASGPVNETWEYDGSGWTLQNPSLAPAARSHMGMVYDAARDRIVLYGGRSGSTPFGDTWEYVVCESDPHVVSVGPARNAVGVSASADITATFSTAMNAGTVTTQTVVAYGAQTGRLSAVVTYDDVARTATLDPAGVFRPGEVVWTSVTSDVLSVGGEPITPTVWQFTAEVGGGSGTFESPAFYGVGSYPYQVAIGDLDGDGDLDLVTANTQSSNISVLMNNGDGTYAAAVNYYTGYAPFAVAVADVDGDSDADILVARDPDIIVFKNNGSGNFTNAGSYDAGSNPISIAPADLDGDGDLDLGVARHGNGLPISVLLNQGDGSFAPRVDYTVGDRPFTIAAGDLDRDGDVDLAVGNLDSHNVSVLMNNGDGTFASQVSYTLNSHVFSVALGDLNADGYLDLAATNYYSQAVSILLNEGDGTFAAQVTYSTANDYVSCVALGDLDGDGDLDMMVANEGGDTSVFLNNGDGTFAPRVNYNEVYQSRFVVLGDLDGDGDLDAAFAHYANHKVWVLLNGVVAPIPPAAVVIAGPTVGTIGTAYSFTATVSPSVATTPITYSWQATNQQPLTRTDGITNAVVFTWTVGGFQLVTVTVQNAAGMVSSVHEIEIGFPIYQVTISPTLKTVTCRSVYSITNESESEAVTFHEFYTMADQPVYEFAGDPIPPGQTKSYRLSAIIGLGMPFEGYVVVSADRPITYSLNVCPDDVPPQITATDPVSAATDVALTAPVVVTFSEPIAVASFTYTVEPDPGGWAAVWNSSTSVVTLTHAPFAYATIYTVTVTAANDLRGNLLADAPYVWSFATTDAPSPCPNPLIGVLISGPASGYVDVAYTFDAVIDPPEATLPITYTWSPVPIAGQGTESASYLWAVPGSYTLTLTAENCGGVVFEDTHVVSIEPPPSPSPGDNYEPDDTCSEGSEIPTDGTVQRHTFHAEGDQDWVTFYATAGITYTIEARVPPTSTADVVLEMYASCSGGAGGGDDPFFSPDIYLQLVVPASGAYHLRLTNHSPGNYGDDVAYNLTVRQATVAQPGALVLVAGRYSSTDPLQNNIHAVTNAVYRLFRQHGYDEGRIHYLATTYNLDADNDGQNDVDALATVPNLQQAIANAAAQVGPDRAFTIYLMDHGSYDRFYLDKVYNQWFSPGDLDAWLDTLETSVPGVKVNVIVDACFSGSFIDPWSEISKANRVVIASTGAYASAYASDTGAVFSDAFIDALDQGMSLQGAFNEADWAARLAHPSQTPWLDDDGDAVPNTARDGQEAAQRGFAFPGTFAAEVWPPYVVQAEVRNYAGGVGEIWAKIVDDEDVRWAWAVIYPPSYEPPEPGDELQEEPSPVPLLNRGNDWYSIAYPQFGERGEYRILVYAEDWIGLQGRPRLVTLRTGWGIYLPLVMRRG